MSLKDMLDSMLIFQSKELFFLCAMTASAGRI